MSTQQKVIQVEQIGPLRSLGRLVVGYALGRVALVAVLIVGGLMLGAPHGEHSPVAARDPSAAVLRPGGPKVAPALIEPVKTGATGVTYR